MNILKMHAWLWNNKVKVQVPLEGLIHGVLPICFSERLCFTLDTGVPILPYPHQHQQSFTKSFPVVIF